MLRNGFFRRISVVSVVAVVATVAAGFVAGCQRERDEPPDDAIIKSPELEEYIIAGVNNFIYYNYSFHYYH